MNRAEFALQLLKKHGTVENGFIADNFPEKVYTWRNAIAEAQQILMPGETIVAYIKGKDWRKHSYTFKPAEAPRTGEGVQCPKCKEVWSKLKASGLCPECDEAEQTPAARCKPKNGSVQEDLFDYKSRAAGE